VWTVNDPRQMTELIKRGIDNIITSDPDTAICVRNQWVELSPAERLVLASRILLGLEI
jgi:glycerophosphoryl diester phosphodiesterase